MIRFFFRDTYIYLDIIAATTITFLFITGGKLEHRYTLGGNGGWEA